MISPEELGAPKIDPPAIADADRPDWSVMIPVYQRTTWLEMAIESALSQFRPDENVQIEVVDDSSDSSERVREIVQRVGGGRVGYSRNGQRLGMVENWNQCLRRSVGRWVHVLHDDDAVLDGFYAAMAEGFRQCPGAGFAFSGTAYIDAAGNVTNTPKALLPAAAPMHDWSEWIGLTNLVIFPSVALRRSALEAVGGFHPALSHAVDWEMWLRLAVHFAVWHDPRVLACYRQHNDSETARQSAEAENVEDVARALAIARRYFPPDRADELVSRAGATWAYGAINGARGKLMQGELVAAVTWVDRALQLAISPLILRNIESGLMRHFDQFLASASDTLHRYRVVPTDRAAADKARYLRRLLLRQWLALPPSHWRFYADMELGRWHRLLAASPVVNEPADGVDVALMEKVTSPLIQALINPLFPAQSRFPAPVPAALPPWVQRFLATK